MNVLPFVMAMLMLLTILTYGRLQSFRSFQGFVHGFSAFIEKGERESYNRMMEDKYDDITVLKNNSDSEKSNPIKAVSKLNLGVLLNPGKDPQRYEVYAQLTKRLVHQIYCDQPYFKELEQERPSYMDELLQSLGRVDKKMTTLSQLDNLKLPDPFLNELLYRLLKKQAEGPSLRDHVTVYNQDNIRLFLASSQLLQAIYGDPQVVGAIIEKRRELYRLISRKEGLSVEDASKQFDAFAKQFGTTVQPYLNTDVSKTNPNRN